MPIGSVIGTSWQSALPQRACAAVLTQGAPYGFDGLVGRPSPPKGDEDRINLHKNMVAHSGRYTVEGREGGPLY
jgi:hypothetical protein